MLVSVMLCQSAPTPKPVFGGDPTVPWDPTIPWGIYGPSHMLACLYTDLNHLVGGRCAHLIEMSCQEERRAEAVKGELKEEEKKGEAEEKEGEAEEKKGKAEMAKGEEEEKKGEAEEKKGEEEVNKGEETGNKVRHFGRLPNCLSACGSPPPPGQPSTGCGSL